MEAIGLIEDFIYFSRANCVFIAALTKDLLAFLTWSLNTEPPFLTHTYTHHAVTYIKQLSSYQHSPRTAPAFPPSPSLSHTHQQNPSITELPHTLHINSAAVLSVSPSLLPNILPVFLRVSQEISFYKAAKHAHTHNPKHPEETKWGQTRAQPDTHTHFFWEQYYCFNPDAPTTGHWKWEFQDQWEWCDQNTLQGT